MDNAQVEGGREQIRLNATKVTKNVSYTGEFLVCWLHSQLAVRVQYFRDLQLIYFLVVLTKRLVTVLLLLEMDLFCTNKINAIEYRKAMVSI